MSQLLSPIYSWAASSNDDFNIQIKKFVNLPQVEIPFYLSLQQAKEKQKIENFNKISMQIELSHNDIPKGPRGSFFVLYGMRVGSSLCDLYMPKEKND